MWGYIPPNHVLLAQKCFVTSYISRFTKAKEYGYEIWYMECQTYIYRTGSLRDNFTSGF
jgi:hypothetical protein